MVRFSDDHVGEPSIVRSVPPRSEMISNRFLRKC